VVLNFGSILLVHRCVRELCVMTELHLGVVPVLYNWPPLFTSKLPLHMGDLDPRLIHGSLGPIDVDQFSGVCRDHNCDRLTNRQTTLLHL